MTRRLPLTSLHRLLTPRYNSTPTNAVRTAICYRNSSAAAALAAPNTAKCDLLQKDLLDSLKSDDIFRAWRLFEESLANPSTQSSALSTSDCNKLIMHVRNHSRSIANKFQYRSENTMKIHQFMIDNNIPRDLNTYNNLLNGNIGNLAATETLLKHLQRDDIDVSDSRIQLPLMVSYVLAGETRQAEVAFQGLMSRPETRTLRVLNAYLRALSTKSPFHSNNPITTMTTLLKRSKKDYELAPDKDSYRALLNAYIKQNDTQKAFEVQNIMRRNKLSFSVPMFEELITACLRWEKAGDAPLTKLAWTQMNEAFIDTSAVKRQLGVRVFAKFGDLDSAWEQYSGLSARKLLPVPVLQDLGRITVAEGLTDAKEIAKKFEIDLTPTFYRHLLVAFDGQKGTTGSTIESLVRDMLAAGVEVQHKDWFAVIRAHLRDGAVGEARRVLEECQGRGKPFAGSVYAMLLRDSWDHENGVPKESFAEVLGDLEKMGTTTKEEVLRWFERKLDRDHPLRKASLPTLMSSSG
ncbi:hypothetical protein HK097_007394 [Rhizophlyctis rosea]|uniref:Pentatricopeptide repeat-containing protein-mitochondrial domain-containing protein n=1 Tax=Rhizophlyctis rosea TaxID=64517 RepID=A0AAD5X4K4_9FUNG|nr:hypothetical protein HK097_007394 [Rhizophlyctis rosea]